MQQINVVNLSPVLLPHIASFDIRRVYRICWNSGHHRGQSCSIHRWPILQSSLKAIGWELAVNESWIGQSSNLARMGRRYLTRGKGDWRRPHSHYRWYCCLSNCIEIDGTRELKKKLKNVGNGKLVAVEENLVDKVWGSNRPQRPVNPVFILSEKYAGISLCFVNSRRKIFSR